MISLEVLRPITRGYAARLLFDVLLFSHTCHIATGHIAILSRIRNVATTALRLVHVLVLVWDFPMLGSLQKAGPKLCSSMRRRLRVQWSALPLPQRPSIGFVRFVQQDPSLGGLHHAHHDLATVLSLGSDALQQPDDAFPWHISTLLSTSCASL